MLDKIKTLYLKSRPKLYVPYTIILGLIGLINFYFIFVVTPVPNDECIWKPTKVFSDSSIYTFSQVKIEGVAWEAGIRDGDHLLKINGKHIGTNALVANRLLLNSTYGDSAIYTVWRDGEIFETKLEVKKLIQFNALAMNLLSVIWLFVAFVVVRSKPAGESQILFYRVGASLILLSMFSLSQRLNGYNPLLFYPVLAHVVDVIQTFGACFMPFLLVHFFWVFPRKFKIMEKRLTLRILYIWPLLLFIVLILFKYKAYSEMDYGFKLISIFGFIPFAHAIAAAFIGLISLFINYTRLNQKSERTAIFIILISYCIGVLVFIYTLTIANALADNIYNSPHYYMPIILVAIIPISFGYSVFRYSLMDVTDVVKNAIMYGTATIALAGIYFLLIYTIGQSISSALQTEYQGIIAAIIFIIFAMVFQSTKDKFQGLITKRFYPEQFAYQKVLIKFSNDISSIVGLENILEFARKTFIEELKIEKFGILLKEENINAFILKRGQGFSSEYFLLQNNKNRVTHFLDEKKNLKAQPVIERSEFNAAFGDESYKFEEEEIYTIIPLTIKSKVIGFLLFGLKYSGAQFAGKDLELLVAAANQTAVSIENARLYESEAEKVKLERDLHNARRIQESLLPNEIPQIKGLDLSGKMIPAFHVGGDYYDLIKISDSKLFLVIGDVSGKGLAASFYMSKLQTMMRLFCTENRSPKEILERVNNNMFGSIQRNMFITVSLALFDTERRIVTYCRAGHTPLIITNGKAESRVQPRGIGVGLESGEIFDRTLEEVEIPLNSNDLLIFFSDGINEAMNEKDELFGMERLENIAKTFFGDTSDEMLTRLLNSLDSFRQSAAQNDDITIVLARATF